MENNLETEHIKYCRTCLVEIDENSDFTLLECTEPDTKSTIQQKLLNVLPEINLNVTPDAIVCHDCAIVIKSTYQFKKRCLEIEVTICKSLQENPSSVNFMTIVHKHKNNAFNKNPIKLEFEVDDKYETEELNSIVSNQKVETKEQQEQKEKKIKTNHSRLSFTSNNEEEVRKDDLEKLSQLEIVDLASVEFNTDLFNFIDGWEGEERNNNEFNGESEDETSVKSKDNKEVCETVGPFICFHCGYSAILKPNLIKHIQNHVKTMKVIIKDKKRSELYKCSHCDYAINTEIEFEKHSAATHGDYRPYKCTQCKYGAKFKPVLRAHMLTHSSKKPFKCNECNFTTAYKNYLARHKKKHKTGRQFKCKFCTYSSYTKKFLKIHMKQHTGKQFKCNQCDYLGACKMHLDGPKKIHAKVKSFKCNVCDYAAVTRRILKSHLLSHTGEKPYKCKICEFSTAQATNLKIHTRMHTGDKPYKCTTCGYRAISKTQLSRHENIHLEDKPYKCGECGYITSQPGYLKIHMQQHTGKKPYKCTSCSYSAYFKTNLIAHIRIHTGEKPYKCTSCSYSAYFKTNLTTHIRIHTGEKPYKCKLCNYASAQSSSLKLHMKRHLKEVK